MLHFQILFPCFSFTTPIYLGESSSSPLGGIHLGWSLSDCGSFSESVCDYVWNTQNPLKRNYTIPSMNQLLTLFLKACVLLKNHLHGVENLLQMKEGSKDRTALHTRSVGLLWIQFQILPNSSYIMLHFLVL